MNHCGGAINKLIKIMTSRFPAKALRPGSENVKTLKEFLEFLSRWESHAKGSAGVLVAADFLEFMPL
ncbi:hypothetical protein V5799_005412 [Amblyomma americanum]|uniref:Uncharacterized protein n=1 Tax=Amblyomma americanum TaxID=6943 RepID=A0AAQ4DZB7_AMBAM